MANADFERLTDFLSRMIENTVMKLTFQMKRIMKKLKTKLH